MLGFLLILIAVILFISILSICHLSNKNKNQQKYYDDKISKQTYDINKWQNQSNQWKQSSETWENTFTSFKQDIDKQKEIEKEINKRRRVTPKMKATILERDKETCQICGISRYFMNNFCPGLGDYLLLEIDHIQSVSQGGTGQEEDNLQCLCWRCNKKKGGKKTNEEVKKIIDYGIEYLQPIVKETGVKNNETKIKLNINKDKGEQNEETN